MAGSLVSSAARPWGAGQSPRAKESKLRPSRQGARGGKRSPGQGRMGPRQIGGSGDPAITPPIPGQDPLGRLEGPFRTGRPGPLGFHQGRHPGGQIGIKRGPDWPHARPFPRELNHQAPGRAPIEPKRTRPMDPPSKLPPPPLTTGRQGWIAAASDGQAVPSLQATGVGSWGRALARCPAASLGEA